MLKRIHINQHKIRSNKKNNTNEPVITVKTSKSNDYDTEDIYPDSKHLIVSMYQCDNCSAWYEVFHEKKERDEVEQTLSLPTLNT